MYSPKYRNYRETEYNCVRNDILTTPTSCLNRHARTQRTQPWTTSEDFEAHCSHFANTTVPWILLWTVGRRGAWRRQHGVFMFFVQPLSSSIATLFHFAATSVLPFPILPCSVVDQSLRVFRSEYSFRVISEHSLECLLIKLDLGNWEFRFQCSLTTRYRKPWLTTPTLHPFIQYEKKTSWNTHIKNWRNGQRTSQILIIENRNCSWHP